MAIEVTNLNQSETRDVLEQVGEDFTRIAKLVTGQFIHTTPQEHERWNCADEEPAGPDPTTRVFKNLLGVFDMFENVEEAHGIEVVGLCRRNAEGQIVNDESSTGSAVGSSLNQGEVTVDPNHLVPDRCETRGDCARAASKFENRCARRDAEPLHVPLNQAITGQMPEVAIFSFLERRHDPRIGDGECGCVGLEL